MCGAVQALGILSHSGLQQGQGLKNNGALRRNQGALRMPPGMSLVGSEKRVDTNRGG
jgi:hypothetical protein